MIVWPCPLDVSAYAALGREVARPTVACPRCGGETGPWSGYLRHVRDVGLHRIFVPRVRCRRCGQTSALLPWFLSPYRYDSVDVIGQALDRHASGQGVRRIAAALERPETTVRGWCRRFGGCAETLAALLLAAAVRAGWSSFELATAPAQRAVDAAGALAAAWARRGGLVSPWRLAVLVTGGAWLGPNTGSPLAPTAGSPVMAGTPADRGIPWQPTPPNPSPSGDTT